MTPTIPVSWGELFDKITILEIKSSRILDPLKKTNVAKELQKLTESVQLCGYVASPESKKTISGLKEINEALWAIEDEIRECERQKDFGPRFIELARSVYVQNDLRASLKRRINVLLNSELIEEKSYQGY
ncbi:MAG: DUF6165 family protein [Desulfobulbaceae bacterium]|nr:DUF6165 family protein [Desulfobulbaceae bacterium]